MKESLFYINIRFPQIIFYILYNMFLKSIIEAEAGSRLSSDIDWNFDIMAEFDVSGDSKSEKSKSKISRSASFSRNHVISDEQENCDYGGDVY